MVSTAHNVEIASTASTKETVRSGGQIFKLGRGAGHLLSGLPTASDSRP